MKIIIFLLFLFTGAFVFCAPLEMILTGDPIFDDIHFLSLETGIAFLSFSPPLASNEVIVFLDKIDDSTLSSYAREAYLRIFNRLSFDTPISFRSDIFSVNVNFNVTIEGNLILNSSVDGNPLNTKTPALLSIPIRIYFSDFFQGYMEPDISIKTTSFSGERFNTNIPTNLSAEYMPVRSFAAFGGSWWNFHIGRDRLFWGSANIGSLVFNDNSPLNDFARFSLFSRNVKYTTIINQLPLKLKNSLFLESEIEWETAQLQNTIHRYYYLHRLDFTLFNKVSIGLMEGLIIGDSQLELRHLNPFIIFHSLYSWNDYPEWMEGHSMAGSILSLEVNWNIIKSLSIYGQFVMNEFALPGEIKSKSVQPPNGLGYLFGIQYSHLFSSWASIFYFEFIYTDPYLNLLSSPFASFIQQDRKGYFYLGYPRDTISLTFGFNLFNNDSLKFYGFLSGLIKGEHNKYGLKWNWEKTSETFNERTPTKTTEYNYSIFFGASWNPFFWLELKAGLIGTLSFNNNYISDNTEAGGHINFSASFKY